MKSIFRMTFLEMSISLVTRYKIKYATYHRSIILMFGQRMCIFPIHCCTKKVRLLIEINHCYSTFSSVTFFYYPTFLRKLLWKSERSLWNIRYKCMRAKRGRKDILIHMYVHPYVHWLDRRINIMLRCRRALFARVKCARNRS